ncbi:UNVERIFIED_CONTAM: hypothetical protein Slati_1679700 [Sesamum latifolium]|uniref:Retrotransposon gag domain-containing protein n=1 Tax=Sesamum latifolium TaxID=2727402 RepID=A0AAW2WVR1_9LAMI
MARAILSSTWLISLKHAIMQKQMAIICVKQFVQLLKGNAFDWYTDLEAGSIDGWEQLEQEFVNHFYSTRQAVSMLPPLRCAFKGDFGVFDIFSKGSYPNPSEELATRAHEIELSMTASGVEGTPIQELRRTKEKHELKSTANDSVRPKNNVPYKKPQRKLNLKEMQARQYPFLDSDVSRIFDDLLEANLIDLPEMKWSEEAERKDDPEYKTASC